MTDITPDQPAPDAVNVTIDGKTVAARPGELVIEAAEHAGVYIPRFCYHPRMEPVGMCRMCLVEISGPRGFSLQPACYVHTAEGQEIRTDSAKARKAQEGVLEFLLVNHPLDCPVCDKGGECPLQDQALTHGPGESRFIEEKRHFEKPIEIGPLIYLDRERCIQCARCTRFAEEIAGDALIDFAARGDAIEVAPFPGRPFDSYFSGNTVQICPVGALTATPYRFKSRPWDLEQVETTCTGCAVGCRVVAQSSAGEVVRYLGIDSDPVNQSWLCDKGRFGFEAIYAESRLTHPLVRHNGDLEPARWSDALREVAAGIRQARSRGGDAAIAFVGGARLTNEEAYAWAKLAKSVVGTDAVDAQLGDGLPADLVLGLPRATIEEAAKAKLVLLLAPDLREELPVLFLRLRHAAVHGNLKLLECAPAPSALSKHAAVRVGFLPGEAARLASALCSKEPAEISGADPADLAAGRALLGEVAALAPAEAGQGIVVVLGRTSLAEDASDLAAAASVLASALPGARFLPALRRANVHGALDMGLSPGLLPGRVAIDEGRAWYETAWGGVPERRGLDTRAILEAAARGEVSMLVLLGSDPLSDFPDAELARAALQRVDLLVALGTHRDASNALAHVVLPIAGFDERSGSTTNLEGRVTRLAQKVVPPGVAWPAWSVAAGVARQLGADLGFETLESLSEEIANLVPSHRGLRAEVLGRPELRDGVVVPVTSAKVSISGVRARGAAGPLPIDPMATPGILSVREQGAPIGAGSPEQRAEAPAWAPPGTPPPLLRAPRYLPTPTPRLDAYSLRLVLRRRLYDAGTLLGASASLAPLASDAVLGVHPTVLAQLGVKEGERVRCRSARGALEVAVVAEAGIARQVATLTWNAPQAAGAVLVDASAPVTDVRVETIQ